MAEKESRLNEESIVRLVRLARSLEAAGLYNAAKVIWATVYSEETHASLQLAALNTPQALDEELVSVTKMLENAGANPVLITALQRSRQATLEKRTISHAEVPHTYVCRKCGEFILTAEPSPCPNCGAEQLTLREFLPVYFLEPLHPRIVLDALAAAPDILDGFVQGLTEEQMSQAPRPGEWSIREVLAHVLMSQRLLASRIERMLSGNNPSLEGVGAWALQSGQAISAAEILERFRISRNATVHLLQEMMPQEWWRSARHEEFNNVTILHQASYFAKHERDHWTQIGMIRKALGI